MVIFKISNTSFIEINGVKLISQGRFKIIGRIENNKDNISFFELK